MTPNLKIQILFLLIPMIGLLACKSKPSSETRNDFKQFYQHYQVEGSFVLYDQNKDKYIIYNEPQLNQNFTPASTFKICNTLIGLETGVIKDANFIIPWDSIIRQRPNWNKDNNLREAYKNSTVWYYQEVARRVGGKQMKYWLDTAEYGNEDTSGGIDKFWLSGGLRITPYQQIDFLKRLHDKQLPFSQRSLNIVKDIMIAKDTLDYVIRAKTGWGFQDKEEIGWYVGYLETKGNVYYFANCIQSTDTTNDDFGRARIDIVYQILDALKLVKK